jgi:hypothetical protein
MEEGNNLSSFSISDGGIFSLTDQVKHKLKVIEKLGMVASFFLFPLLFALIFLPSLG